MVLKCRLLKNFAGAQRSEAMTQIPKNLESRLADCARRFKLPPVAEKIIELGQKSENDLGAVADAIGSDPAIAEKIIRMANSVFYARRRQSSNLRQAMIVLGLNATFTLALGFSLVSALRVTGREGLNFDSFWRRALMASAWGKLLAMEFGRRDAEEVFVASLLQDIGMLVIDELAPETYKNDSSFDMDQSTISEHEKSILKTDHRTIGAWLLQSWDMPENIVQAVKHSHELTAADLAPEIRGFTRTVALTSQLIDVFLAPPNEEAIGQIGRLAHRHFGISPNRLAELLETIRQQAHIAESIFEMEVFSAGQLQQITATAREVLVIPNLCELQTGKEFTPATSKPENAVFNFESDKDAATGVYSRRGFEMILRRELDAAQKNDWPLSVITVGLDLCRETGDFQGCNVHADMLLDMSELLTENIRETDYVAHYEGKDFVLVLPGRGSKAAENVAERLIAAAHGRTTNSNRGELVETTLSLGIATHDSDNRFQLCSELVSAADEALYHSQRCGRDQYTSYADIKAA
jgi:diguanylate cyclase (GGDEF)-like protein